MYDRPAITMALLFSLLSAVACHQEPQHKGAAPGDVKSDARADSKKPDIWPDGYLVVSEAEWIPVINEAGKQLEAAHKDFVAGDKNRTVADLHAASNAIRGDREMAQPDEQKQLDQSAKSLDQLAERFAQGKVRDEAFEQALVKAYRDDVRVSWLYSEDSEIQPYLDRPSEHTARALSMLSKHDGADAAKEIRRSAAFFRLAELSARPDDREILQHNVDRLNAMAKRADAGKLTREELRQTLAEVDAAYAASYLHQAEDDYLGQRKDVQRVPRALREAVARIRSRMGTLDKEMEATSTALVTELETMTRDLEHGVKVGAKHASSVFERAHKQIKLDASDKATSDKAMGHIAATDR